MDRHSREPGLRHSRRHLRTRCEFRISARHPSYTGALLAILGLDICFGNWLSLMIGVLPPLMAFMRRIAIEERALSSALGDSYLRYMARTKRLLPFIY